MIRAPRIAVADDEPDVREHMVAEIDGVRGIINQIEVLVPSRRNDVRPFSPGVSIGQDRADPGATPSPEEIYVVV